MEENVSSLFDLDDDDFLEAQNRRKTSKKRDENLYAPKADDGKDGKYESVIRGIPYLKDKKLSKYIKYSAKLVHPVTGEWLYIDCPSTNGGSSILLSLEIALKKLKKEGEEEIVKEISENFNRWHNIFSPVYIKQDPYNPEVENTIKIFKYGHQINQLIMNEMPKKEEDESALKIKTNKINPFHLLKGKDMIYTAKKKNKNWSDYTESHFVDERSPLIYKIGDKEIAVSKDEKVMKLTYEYLMKNTPSMDPYLFKPWTDEEYEKVATFIKAIVPYKTILDQVVAKTRDEKIKALFSENTSGGSSSPVSESVEFTKEEESIDTPIEAPQSETNAEESVEEPKAETPQTEEPATEAKVEESSNDGPMSSDEIDSLLDDI